ncbi:MAG: ApbE family lipoprotein [Chitinophagaceae bacterium]|nr:ApbE family lipoprotein [Chitinophagaceae bacterium]
MQRGLTILIGIVFLQFTNYPGKKTFYIEGATQGTTYHITYFAEEGFVSKVDIDDQLSKIDSSLSIYQPYSLISQFNNSSAGIQIDSNFAEVIKKSIGIFNDTGGAFDITVQPLVQAWGFGVNKENILPDSQKIHSILNCVGTNKIQLQNNSLKKDLPCIHIDVNGIAQGYTVDVLAALLEKKNIDNYLVEVGGEIRVRGRKPGGEKMTIGIESPLKDEFDAQSIKTFIHTEYGAITTSGNYRKFYESGGRKISHLIDPASGYPVQNELISVTVYAKDAITADGYDNALMVFGLSKSFQFLKNHPGLEAYFIYHTPGGGIADTATGGFYKLMNAGM